MHRSSFLKLGFYKSWQIQHLSKTQKQILLFEISKLNDLNPSQKSHFLKDLFSEMRPHFQWQENLLQTQRKKGQHLNFSLDRSFDWIDSLLGINYIEDERLLSSGDSAEKEQERLYLNSGLGVQTNYGNLSLVLAELDLNSESVIFDLGSGFGRLGFMVGFSFPEVQFHGYEILISRVEQSNQIAKNFGLQERVHFHSENLSHAAIPYSQANIFYLYDPFHEATYLKIAQKIAEVSKNKKVQIVTKGHSKKYILDIALENSWPSPESYFFGNLNIFRNYQI